MASGIRRRQQRPPTAPHVTGRTQAVQQQKNRLSAAPVLHAHRLDHAEQSPTVVGVDGERPGYGWQYDTSVLRSHRGQTCVTARANA
jgi:hypothetical protein